MYNPPVYKEKPSIDPLFSTILEYTTITSKDISHFTADLTGPKLLIPETEAVSWGWAIPGSPFNLYPINQFKNFLTTKTIDILSPAGSERTSYIYTADQVTPYDPGRDQPLLYIGKSFRPYQIIKTLTTRLPVYLHPLTQTYLANCRRVDQLIYPVNRQNHPVIAPQTTTCIYTSDRQLLEDRGPSSTPDQDLNFYLGNRQYVYALHKHGYHFLTLVTHPTQSSNPQLHPSADFVPPANIAIPSVSQLAYDYLHPHFHFQTKK